MFGGSSELYGRAAPSSLGKVGGLWPWPVFLSLDIVNDLGP